MPSIWSICFSMLLVAGNQNLLSVHLQIWLPWTRRPDPDYFGYVWRAKPHIVPIRMSLLMISISQCLVSRLLIKFWLWQKFPLFCIVVELTPFEAKCVDKMEVGTRSQFSSSSFTVSPVLFALQEMDLFPFKKAIWDRKKLCLLQYVDRFSPLATLGTKVYHLSKSFQQCNATQFKTLLPQGQRGLVWTYLVGVLYDPTSV